MNEDPMHNVNREPLFERLFKLLTGRKAIALIGFCILLSAAAGAQQDKTKTPANKTASSSAASETHLPTEETVNAFMHASLGYNPNVSWKVTSIKPSQAMGLTEVTVSIAGPQGLQNYELYVTQDGKHAISGQIIPFGAHPFEAARVKLEKEQNGFSRGPATAPVTIYEFGDLQCPHCKEAQPTIERLLSDEKNVKLVFQNFPLQSHDWAEKGAAYADCVGRASGIKSSNDVFWKFIQSVYDAQTDILAENADNKLKALADAAGANGNEISECAAKAATLGRVERSVELGEAVGVTGTPTLFINGRMVGDLGSVPYEILKELVQFAAQEKTAEKK